MTPEMIVMRFALSQRSKAKLREMAAKRGCSIEEVIRNVLPPGSNVEGDVVTLVLPKPRGTTEETT